MKLKILLPLAATLVASPVWANAQSSLSLSTKTLSFNGSSGNVSSQPLTLTISGSQPVTIRSISFSNGVFSAPSMALPATLPGGRSYTAQISAKPESSAQTGTLTIGSSAGTITVSLAETAMQATGTHKVALTWQKPTTGDNVVSYDVDRAPSGGSSFSQVGSTGGGTRNWTDTSVQSGQSYTYRVRSVGDDGDTSAPSNTVTLSIP